MSARETTNAAPNETKTMEFADPIHYPTLAKYGFPTDSQEEINALMRDLWKLQESEDNNVKPFSFIHSNNRLGMLLPIPRASSQLLFKCALKKNNFISHMLDFIVKGSECTKNDVAEWLLSYLADEFEEEFMSMAILNGVVVSPKIMNAETVAAMCQEANINVSCLRSILRYFHHVFGCRLAVPEKQVRLLGDNTIQPECGHYINEERKWIDFWFKPVAKLLKHEVNSVLSHYDFIHLKHVDLVIGGDHGKGRFHMVKQLLLCYEDESNPTKDFVIQHGQIESTKDSLEVLKKPIGFPIAESMA